MLYMSIRCRLYLLLWIFYRLWTLLEDACTELDFRMAEVNHGENVVISDSFIQYSIALQQGPSWKSELESQMAHVKLLEPHF